VRDVPTSPHFDLPRRGQHPGATGDAFLSAEALLKDHTTAIPGLPDDLISRDDERLVAFIDGLRDSVRARVAEGQQRGLPLSEIVVQVRAMVRLAEEADHPVPFPARAFKAISRQAVGWCVEAYRPTLSQTSDVSIPTQSST
jgi:hypothetical protein